MHALLGSATTLRLLEIVCKLYINNCDITMGFLHLLSNENFRTFICVSLFFQRQFYSNVIMRSSSTGYATDANLSGIAESQAPLTSQYRLPLLTMPHLVVQYFLLRPVSPLGAKLQFFTVERMP